MALGQQGNLPRQSYVQLDNIQTVNTARFLKHLGTLDTATMRMIGRKLILALGARQLGVATGGIAAKASPCAHDERDRFVGAARGF